MKHVIGLSGGKDSTALALRLMEVEPREYELICNATGNELPEMVEHWAKLERMLGLPIKRVGHTTDLYGLIDEMQMLPNFRARWCTRILKIEPTIKYFESLPEGSVLYVGLRADEEARRGIYGEDKGMEARFTTTSVGGKRAVQTLAVALAEQVEKDQTKPVPVVRLKKDHYAHKSYGKIYTPVFEIVEWVSMDGESPEVKPEPEAAPSRRRRSA